MTLIDSHCHLDYPDFADELDAVVERAHAAGVERMVTIGTRMDKAARLVQIAERYPGVFFTVGVHPHEAANAADEDFAKMREIAKHPKCVGIGEAGLDYHYNFAPASIAERVFREQIGIARALRLPIVIHTREADADTASILEEEMKRGPFQMLMHCFTSSRELAETALGLGAYISFSGVVTFRKSDDLRAIVRDTPLDRVLVETDSPYLAPAPWRGKRNEPAYVVQTARVIAETKGLPLEALAEATSANALRVFAKMADGKP